jgi:DNA-binding NarL/FixJ family response regulator
MLTTSSSQIAIEAAYKLGANLFIKKPMDFKDLQNIIRLVVSADWSRQKYPAELSGTAYCISFPI